MMISAKIHHANSEKVQDLNPEIRKSSVEQDFADLFAQASKYYAEARKYMDRGDMENANTHLAMAMDYATLAFDQNNGQVG